MNQLHNRGPDQPSPSTPSQQSPGTKRALSSRAKLRDIFRKSLLAITSTTIMVSILLGADLYFHHKHGVNLWGYRGPAVGRKQPGEKRVAVFGGSTAWGFGLSAGQDFPGQMQQRLAARPQAGGPITMLNLAYNSEGAYSFKYTLADYDYLDYDLVVLYSGYNDLGPNLYVFRRQSPVFKWTGYMPLLPALAADKIKVWRNRGRKENSPIVFAGSGGNDEETRQRLEQSNRAPASDTDSAEINNGEWDFYCDQVYQAADMALKRGKRVLVVTEPYISAKHIRQQQALENMLRQRFAGQANLRYLNLGRVVDLHDTALCWDGMHLTEEGNRRIAEALLPTVLEMIQR
jgi:lysophospholipase L1-like esterase